MTLAGFPRLGPWVYSVPPRSRRRYYTVTGPLPSSLMQTMTVNLHRFRVVHLFVALMLTGTITVSATGALTQSQLITDVALLEGSKGILEINDVAQEDFMAVSDTIS